MFSNAALQKPLQYIRKVGPKRAERLKELGIQTVGDLLRYFPREHEDRTRRSTAGQLRPGTAATLEGVISDFAVARVGPSLSLGKALIKDATGSAVATWFRRHSYRYDAFAALRKQLVPGAKLMVHGRAEYGPNGLQLRVEEHEMAAEAGHSPIHLNRLVPIYPLTEGLEPRFFRELVWQCLEESLSSVADDMPEDFRKSNSLAALPWALERIHFPGTWEELAQARRRLAFEEFFYFQLAMRFARASRAAEQSGAPCKPSRALLSPFRSALGFEFTPAQKHVINEIFQDMAAEKPMNRLLQGDVGSGKTVVALSAMLLAVENGLQAALMAPTEILAEQHFLSLGKFLNGIPLRAGLFTSSLPAKRKREQLDALRTGELQLAVGTHSLLEEDVQFHRLGLAVIDEQHRFGVRQKGRLFEKAGKSPHVLTMTATPIPRTLAMTLYGDLSVSTISSPPPGRPPVTTRRATEREALSAVSRALARGERAFVVFPLVEESDKLALKAAVKEFEKLQAIFPQYKVGLLHGRLTSEEKEAAMAAFKDGEIQLLAATPVVEVGIDVPQATVMVVMHADRFGLAQLHQLRGRVGRGKGDSECCLVSSSRTPEAAKRLELLCRTRDGFILAEEDLKMRGPGEFLGEAQHGAAEFRAGNLVSDAALIVETRRAMEKVLEKDPFFESAEHRFILTSLKSRFGERLGFGRVG